MFEEPEAIRFKILGPLEIRQKYENYNWVEPSFEPEIDLNFLGVNAKVIIKSKEDKNES
jgi:hypothetical protein